jgi:large subunit ribosomal protein L21
MYAVIATGGKQERVEVGSRIDIERVRAHDDGTVSFLPVLLVDADRVVADPARLSSAKVFARVVGEAKGPKIVGFTYKAKTRSRRRFGHRQRYMTVEITEITENAAEGPAPASATA